MARAPEVGGTYQPSQTAVKELLFRSPEGRVYAIPNDPAKIREVTSHGWTRENQTHWGAITGGFLGSMLGTPGGYPGRALGAMAGGAAGEAIPQLVSGQFNPDEIQNQALTQAAMETGGTAAAALARGGGRLFGNLALNASPALKQEFGRLSETLLSPEVRARVGKFPVVRDLLAGKLSWQSAAEKIDKMRAASAEKEWNLIRTASQNKPPVALSAFTDAALNDAENANLLQGNGPLTSDVRKAIYDDTRQTISNLLANRGFGHLKPNVDVLTWPQVQILKQEAQNASPALYRAQRAGTVPAGNPGLTAKIGQTAKDLLHGPNGIPGLQQQAAQTQDLIGLNRAMLAREGRGMAGPAGREQQWIAGRNLTYGGLGVLGGAGAQSFGQTPEQRIQYGLEGLLAGALLGKAQPLSMAALGLTDPAFQALLRAAPWMGQALSQPGPPPVLPSQP